MAEEILGHQGMVSLIPVMEKEIGRHIKIETQGAQNHQADRFTVLFSLLTPPGPPVPCGSQNERNNAESEIFHDKGLPGLLISPVNEALSERELP
jgi:hypothetical protein